MTSAAATASVTSAEKSTLLSLDVEHLVSEIKENLRLSGFKSRRHRTHFVRTKPYSKPTACELCSDRRSCRCDDDIQTNDDPYEMLQALLREGSLVKEAVRRLQIGLSPKQRYFYESDDESSRSPKFRLCWNVYHTINILVPFCKIVIRLYLYKSFSIYYLKMSHKYKIQWWLTYWNFKSNNCFILSNTHFLE